MFTGLVECQGTVLRIESQEPGVKMTVRQPQIAADAELGDSVAFNGCCLTLVSIDADCFSVECGPETLARTNLGKLQPGHLVNLERSLQLGDRLGGHLVTGHIDAVGTLAARHDEGQWSTFWFAAPAAVMKQVASKGSIAVDGVSLTVVDAEQEQFSTALIPHTLEVTTIGKLTPGDQVNLETDLLAKYIERQLNFQ